MKIAYVSLHWLRTFSGGVGKKIHRQISAWEAAGHEVKLFMHAAKRRDSPPHIPAEIFYYTESSKLFSELRRISAIYSLIKAVRAFHPDIIYIRYGMYVYPVHWLAGVAPLVEEITTNDLDQHGGLGFLYGLYNRFTRGILMNSTSGLVCLSRELAEASFNAKYRKPTMVIGDGIDLKIIQPLPAPSNEKPRIGFIGSPDSIWQGVDKLPVLAQACPDLEIHVIGYGGLENNVNAPENLYFHGYMDAEAYKKVLAGMDCAFGSLALHRIHLDESSPLKTRECLALGLPMILPYHDTDLHSLNVDFLLKIPNKEDNIQTHGEAIREFAYRMRGVRADRAALKDRIDSRRKEELRLKFFEEIVREANAKHA